MNNQFKLSIDVLTAVNIIKEQFSADLIDEEIKLINDKVIAILIFEKYYFRVKNRASLVVIIDNIDGETFIKAIGTGGGSGLSTFDWGASDNFVYLLRKELAEFIIE